MEQHFFLDDDDGKIPNFNLYQDYSRGTFYLVGVLIAYSICLNGPAPNFFASWMYDYIVGGQEAVLKCLPTKIQEKSILSRAFNKVRNLTSPNCSVHAKAT